MKDSPTATYVALIAVVVACFVSVSRSSTRDRWKRRFGVIGSPLTRSPTYRVLLLLVIVGALLISVLPEASFVIPALDSVGLDIATILVALELRHYLASAARLGGIRPVARRCGDALRANAVLWSYAGIWAVIRVLTVLGKTMIPPQARIRSRSGP